MQNRSNSYKVIVSCLIAFLLSGVVLSQSTKQQQLEKRREALKEEMRQLQRLRDSNKKKEVSILTEVEDLDTKIKLRADLIKVTNNQANLLTREINENLSRMESLREELTILKKDYGEMIRKSYKSKSGQSRIETNKKLVIQKEDKQALIAENRKAKAELDKEKKQQDALVAEIRKKSSNYASQIKKKQQKSRKIY